MATGWQLWEEPTALAEDAGGTFVPPVASTEPTDPPNHSHPSLTWVPEEWV